jgi:hypothetical protein
LKAHSAAHRDGWAQALVNTGHEEKIAREKQQQEKKKEEEEQRLLDAMYAKVRFILLRGGR